MATRRRGLGRGLEALIPTGKQVSDHLVRIPLDEVSANPQQPRELFDEEALTALADSIRQVGVLQPIIVRPGEKGAYTLVAGERRLRASRLAGLEEIPALVRDVDDSRSLTEALIENIQREDLSPLEEGAAFQQLIEDFDMTHEAVGHAVGKSRASISNAIRLLSLPDSIQALLDSGKLSAGHARALLGIEDAAYAFHVAERASSEGWSVRQVEDAVKARSPLTGARRATSKPLRPAAVVALEERLAEHLGSKVKIDYRNDKGRVVVSFGSSAELEKIYSLLFS